jgi:nitrate/nitrite transport system ATP-binding protein
MALLELTHVNKSFPSRSGRSRVLNDVSLEIQEREFVAILGFSGSGKTTLISLLAGLTVPDSGKVTFRGQSITGPSPERGVVFQNYSLLPWLTALENVSLAVDRVYPSWSPKKRREHAVRHLEMVNLGHALGKKPSELSGGMRQRVAVARALAMNPEVLLLDEPLSALDALTRASLQREIEGIWASEQKTVVLITNDVDEGLLLADRIVPLTPGPGATFGPSFTVSIPRPRDRRALNHDPEFKRLRNDVIRYLTDVRTQHRESGSARMVETRAPADESSTASEPSPISATPSPRVT